MFEFIYSKQRVKPIYKAIRKSVSRDKNVVPLFWTEHCVECAAPLCYKTCDRYKKRADGDCVRIVNGITPTITPDGIGAVCEFRTWGKIESQLKIRLLSGKQYSALYWILTVLGYFFRKIASVSPFRFLQNFVDCGWFSYRQKTINFTLSNKRPHYSLTLEGIVENHDHPSAFLVDVKSNSALLFRETFEAPAGISSLSINIPPYESGKELYFINIHPANAEDHVTVTFNSLKLVPTDITKGKKVKCVIWDLDNTLWNGVLIEGEVKPNDELIKLIKHLDACGIVNSIASKNNEDTVRTKLAELGIEQYFVFSKINWLPKSVNVTTIVKQMNINANTVVFVDDNPFERNEVLLRAPSITCVDPSEMIAFSKCSRFNAIVTEDSKKRRSTYRMLEAMKKEEEEWTGNIDDFLINCNIQAQITLPTDKTIPRCFELLQRTNQLNSSGRRLSLNEVEEIVKSPVYESLVLSSSDKFGDYGIVGFIIIDVSGNVPCATDFVISCRVANKKIEPTLINYLAGKYGGKLFFNYKKTLRNGPMFQIIRELKMERVHSEGEYDVYQCKYDKNYPKVVTLFERGK